MQKWEYKTLNLGWDAEKKFFYWFDLSKSQKVGDETAGQHMDERGIDGRLNEFGQDGWELVGVQSMHHSGTTTLINYYLKRPIS